MINPRTYGFSKTDAEELLQVIGGGDAEYAEVKPRGGGSGSSVKIIQATTGIAARSGTTLGSATCTEFKIEAGVLVTNTETITVRNLSLFAIPANAYLLAHQESISSEWIAQAVINGLRFESPNLQYTIDGTTWVTWHAAGTECPPPP